MSFQLGISIGHSHRYCAIGEEGSVVGFEEVGLVGLNGGDRSKVESRAGSVEAFQLVDCAVERACCCCHGEGKCGVARRGEVAIVRSLVSRELRGHFDSYGIVERKLSGVAVDNKVLARQRRGGGEVVERVVSCHCTLLQILGGYVIGQRSYAHVNIGHGLTHGSFIEMDELR